ncbi:MAG: GNAT family N-acetyltransferase [Cyanobacteria bacterium J06632_22]
MTLADHGAMVKLLAQTPGVTLREADSYGRTQAYLDRNPGLSFLARTEAGEVVGMVMCGHDGRRGYLQHLLVKPDYRGQGLAKALVQRCLDQLATLGIFKTHIFIRQENTTGEAFWQHLGWAERDDVKMYSFNRSSNPNI